MIPGKFDYYAPTSVSEAVSLLAEHGDDAKILAGGQSLIPAMRYRLAVPEVLIDINGLSDLEYIEERNGNLAIGAMAREVDLEEHEAVQRDYPLLAEAAEHIADPLVRNQATVGGNIAHADPANDHPAVMLAYNATVVAQGPNGEREIAIDDFFTDLFEQSLEDDEILTEIRIPKARAGNGGAYMKVERKVGDYAAAAVAVQLTLDGDTCKDIRIGLTNVNYMPMRAKNAEQILTGSDLSDDVLHKAARAAAAECDPSNDLRGSAEYKRSLVRTLTVRTVKKAMARAKGQPTDAPTEIVPTPSG